MHILTDFYSRGHVFYIYALNWRRNRTLHSASYYMLLFVDASYNKKNETWMALARVAMLCNRAEFKAGQEHQPVLKRFAGPKWFPLLVIGLTANK